MTAATFGEFAGQVDQRLTAAVGCQPGRADPVVVARELGRVIGRLARYLDDRAPGYAIGSLSTVDMPPWQRAVVDARTALRWAASCLPETTRTAIRLELRPWETLAGCLAGAATSMMAGRDLLHTHLAPGLDEEQVDRSTWAPVVASPPVTRALIAQIARWSGQVGLIAAQVAAVCASGPQPPAGLADGLQGAAQWLWLARAAVRPAQAAEPVTADDRRLLGAIPAVRSQRRMPPTGEERAAALFQEIAVSAERLRVAVLVTAEHRRWAPPTADAWRWSATAAAVTGQAAEHLLRSLASQPATLPIHPERVHQAADALHQATQAWQQATAQWLDLTTQTRGQNSPVITEIGDLVLRMGRLAWEDPHWTPTRPHTTTRTPPSLAADARDIVAAVHQSAEAFADLAAADTTAVTATDRARRLYVPTRTLPDTCNIPRRYATAPAERTWPLLEAYLTARDASAHAAATLADLALAIDAPSAPLALARAACTPRQPPALSHSHPAAVPAAVAEGLPTQPAMPGPVEQAVQRLRLDDPALLLRAAAIDQAARHLLAQAEQASQPASLPTTTGASAARRPTGGGPALLAAQDSPHTPAAVLASSQRQGPIRPAGRPTSRSRPQPRHRPSQHPPRKLTS